MEIYFVRHATSDVTHKDEPTRPLTKQGLLDTKIITHFFKDKIIDTVYSSPYKRAIDTVKDYATTSNHSIHIIENVKERENGSWIEDFTSYTKQQWNDFNFKGEKGESLKEVQDRNIKIVYELIKKHQDQSIIIAGHGTAISTVIQYFYPDFNYTNFEMIVGINPFMLKLVFDVNNEIQSLIFTNPFTNQETIYM